MEFPLFGKETFLDPETGEEIESTWMVRWGAGVSRVWLMLLVIGLFLGLLWGLDWGWYEKLGFLMGLKQGLLKGLSASFISVVLGGSIYGLVVVVNCKVEPDGTLSDRFGRNDGRITRFHLALSRWHHHRRQRILRSQEYQQVPTTAISPTQPPNEPEPTNTALSRTKSTEEKRPLAAATEEGTAQAVVEDREVGSGGSRESGVPP